MTVTSTQMANAIRALSMDAVQNANSGHPGMPMGMADVATVLFTQVLRHDPSWPKWPNRDRFVLSAGHGSMLLYSALHLSGYAQPTLDEIKSFRQLHSPCAGHPEFGEMPGIETTTGPLGQGLAMSVGMAIAEQVEAARYGNLIDHHTYVIAGDGCLMEGISQEAISLAGHLKLGKLVVLWDDNEISIDGPISLSSSEDQRARFEAAGWHVQAVDGHDQDSVLAAIEEAQNDDRPSMIACKTTIGYGAPTKAGTASSHGAPLGDEEIAGTKKTLDWPHGAFDIPQDIRDEWLSQASHAKDQAAAWKQRFNALDAETRAEFERIHAKDIPAEFDAAVKAYISSLIQEPQKVATRKASEMALNVVNEAFSETIGGSADLTGSNNTKTKDLGLMSADDFSGRYVHYGIREFGMAAAMNGMALHGGVLPYGGTFLVFTDYARPAIRLSALMKQRVVYVMTHDSIGLGEDGPTHQPVEHVASLRAMPNVNVFRPADVVETMECWALAVKAKETPSVLALTRQGLPQLRLEERDDNACAKGGYILKDASNGAPQVTILATGSEVHLAVEAQAALAEKGIHARVVSMPCFELFEAQSADYRKEVLGENTLRVAIEAGVRQGWDRYLGDNGVFIGMDSFGLSAPAGDLFKHFGITADAIVEAVTTRL